MRHVDIKILGLVQGIGFRYSARRQADKLGVTGFVRNEPDGQVCIEAEGEDRAVGEFIKWCRKGPIWARVHSIQIEQSAPKGYNQFEIQY